MASEHPRWKQKSIKNRSKNDVKNGMHLGIDFSSILVDFGTQVGSQNGTQVTPTSSKNRSKNEVKTGRQLGIDLSSILVDFGTQVGKQNRAKIVQKRHRKNDEKTKGNKVAKKSQQDVPTTRDTSGLGPWGGGRGRGKPVPRGLKPEGLKEEGF